VAGETREWSIPAPLRALLWWPPTAFVLVLVAPDVAAGVIALAGAALVALGTLAAAVARRCGSPDGATELLGDGAQPQAVEMLAPQHAA
jgi:hypothetical protein